MNLGFVALLVLALALCLMQTAAILRFRDPQPSLRARVGERVEVGGVAYTLDRFDTEPTLPGRPDQPPVVAPPGASLVAIALTVELRDPDRDPGQIYCTATLVDDRDRRWTNDFDVAYRADLPERATCASLETHPVTPNQPYAVGVAFTIPADAAERVRLWLELETDRVLVEFAR